jgi:hypothetical protein
VPYFAILLYEDCSKVVIKKSLNLVAKGCKVIKKLTKIDPLPRIGEGRACIQRGFTYIPSPFKGEGQGEGEIQN